MPVRNQDHLEFASSLCGDLKSLGLRVMVDDRNESMGYKTRQIQKKKIPFMLVVGDREMESHTVSLREYGSKSSSTISLADLKKKFLELDSKKLPPFLRN